MTAKDKELLLKDLCGRLPYGVKVQTTYINPRTKERKDIGTDVLSTVEISMLIDGYEEHKPYLFPMSSMTEEQEKEWRYTLSSDGNITYDTVDWCNENHFDYRGLIEKGLAIDATNLNIY